MKIGFVHDHPFYEKDGKFYSNSGFPAEAWKRYLVCGDELFVFGRKTSKISQSLSSCDRVNFKLSKYYSNPKSLFLKYRKIRQELADFLSNIDCVVFRIPSILGLMGVEIAIQKKIPFMTEVVADAYASYRYYGNLLGVFAAPYYDFITRKAVMHSEYTLYVTQSFLQSKYPTKGKQLACTNAVITPVSGDVLEKRLIRIKGSNKTRRIVCGEIGDVSVKFKGCHIMLKAMKILKEEGIIVDFHIVGGKNPDAMYALAEKYGVRDQFYYDGYLAHDKIADFYDNIDIYVHPSFQEGLPRVVVEAISRGCPCATSNVAGTPELIEDKYLHKPGDYNKLAKDIKLLIINKTEMARVAEINFKHAKYYYSDILDSRREIFYKDFFNAINNDR